MAAIVRGDDWPALFALPLPPDVQTKAGRAVGGGADVRGCADSSLYRRFRAVGLMQVRTFPQFAVYDDPDSIMVRHYQSRILGVLTPDEANQWQRAVAETGAQGAFLLAAPHHCAIGTKP